MTVTEVTACCPQVCRDGKLLSRADDLRLACCDLHGQTNETIASAAARCAAAGTVEEAASNSGVHWNRGDCLAAKAATGFCMGRGGSSLEAMLGG